MLVHSPSRLSCARSSTGLHPQEGGGTSLSASPSPPPPTLKRPYTSPSVQLTTLPTSVKKRLDLKQLKLRAHITKDKLRRARPTICKDKYVVDGFVRQGQRRSRRQTSQRWQSGPGSRICSTLRDRRGTNSRLSVTDFGRNAKSSSRARRTSRPRETPQGRRDETMPASDSRVMKSTTIASRPRTPISSMDRKPHMSAFSNSGVCSPRTSPFSASWTGRIP